MPKHLIRSIIYIILGLLSSCQSAYNNHVSFHLKDAVKEVRVWRYKVQEINGKMVKKRLVPELLDDPQLYEYSGMPANCKFLFDSVGMIEVMSVYASNNELDFDLWHKDTMFAMHSPDGVLQAYTGGDNRSRPNYLKNYLKTGELVNDVKVVYAGATELSAIHTEYNHQKELVGGDQILL